MAKPPMEIRTRARAHVDRAVERLVDLIDRDDVAPSTQLAASKLLLELANGPPKSGDADEELSTDRQATREILDLVEKTFGAKAIRKLFPRGPKGWSSRRFRKELERDLARQRARQAPAPPES